MMKIYLSPRRMDNTLKSVSVSGRKIFINDECFDFSCMNNGDVIPAEAILSEYINHDIEMVDGCIVAVITIPHGQSAPRETIFPSAFSEPLIITSGSVNLPPYDEERHE
ncbi:hypothetical protein [Aeromonas veronii]|uniref:hypothetical protein n=1 Tax=Aeromonas veronii TaxID=654 RepID=UPI002936EE26|nr:hypothetical protein [Aeromonas veronii]WOE85858.1 hypothetical protein RY930_05530 [Aeromonas veronii]